MNDIERAQDPTTPASELEALAERSSELRINVLLNAGAPRDLLVKLLTEPIPPNVVAAKPAFRGKRIFMGGRTVVWLETLLHNPSVDLERLLDPTFPFLFKDASERSLVESLLVELIKPQGAVSAEGLSPVELQRLWQVVPETSWLGSRLRALVTKDAAERRRTSSVDLLRLAHREVYLALLARGHEKPMATLQALAVQWEVASRWRRALAKEPRIDPTFTSVPPVLAIAVGHFLEESFLA